MNLRCGSVGRRCRRPGDGAHVEIRTRDLFLTKEVLCHLSYVGAPRTGFYRASPLSSRARLSLKVAIAASEYRSTISM
jgi:hypothetical protein